MASKYFTTPKGRAVYPKLITPDTKFNPAGVYQTKLILSAEEAEPLVAQIDEIFTDEFGAKKLPNLNKPYEVNEEGEYIFKMKSNNKPQLFDSAGQLVDAKASVKMATGSILKVKGSIKPSFVQSKYYATLYINAVQIVDIVEQSSGFAAEEGTYKAQNDTTGDDEAEADTGTPDAENTDF